MEALEKLPGIVERIKALPKSDVRELRIMQESEVKALNAFIEACKFGTLWVRIRQVLPLLNSGETDEVIALKVDESRDWVKRARKEAASNCKPLEAAMLFRFAQAYKWWERESRAERAFWDYLRDF